MFEREDDRTTEQRSTHYWLVVGTDKMMGRWGNDCGRFSGASYAAWACRPEYRSQCLAWVESRSDMSRIREVIDGDGLNVGTYRPRGDGHLHIYLWEPSRPAAIS